MGGSSATPATIFETLPTASNKIHEISTDILSAFPPTPNIYDYPHLILLIHKLKSKVDELSNTLSTLWQTLVQEVDEIRSIVQNQENHFNEKGFRMACLQAAATRMDINQRVYTTSARITGEVLLWRNICKSCINKYEWKDLHDKSPTSNIYKSFGMEILRIQSDCRYFLKSSKILMRELALIVKGWNSLRQGIWRTVVMLICQAAQREEDEEMESKSIIAIPEGEELDLITS